MINEQPYPLPDGWQWVTIKDIADVITGSTPSKKNLAYYGGNFPFFKPADLNSGRHVFKATEYLSAEGKKVSRIIPPNSIGVCCIGSIGKCGYFEVEGTTNQQINAVIPKINPLYVYYYFLSDKFVNELLSKASATTISIVNKSKMESCKIPLPPLDEQQRIVDLLDELFTKLDEAKTLAQGVVDGSKLRRASILHKAFIGELTKLWRDEHGTTLDSWQKKFLSDVLISSKQKTNDFSSSDLKYVGLENIEKNGGQISFQAADEVKSTKNIFHAGDLLYGKLRPYLNKHGVAKFDGICSTDILVFKANEQAEIEFINYFLSHPNFIEYAVANSKGINLPRVSESIVLNAEILLPPLEEQKEIVRLLDDLLGKERRTTDLARKTLERIELMKKSILAKAFRGKLRPNEL